MTERFTHLNLVPRKVRELPAHYYLLERVLVRRLGGNYYRISKYQYMRLGDISLSEDWRNMYNTNIILVLGMGVRVIVNIR